MRRTLVVVNPRAGSGRAERIWRLLLSKHPDLADASVVHVDNPARADELVRAALTGSPERVVVVGGDGTLNRIVNVLHGANALGGLGIGLVPAGTGSDMARCLGLPGEPSAALARALNGDGRLVDLLDLAFESGGRSLVVNIASAGVSGPVAEHINALRHRWTGAYLAAAVRALIGFRAVSCRIDLDGRPWFEGRIVLAAFANGCAFGRGLRIAPQAELDDGLMDVVVAEDESLWRLLPAIPRLYRGTHLDLPFVRHARARHVLLRPLGPMPPLEMDGEARTGGSVTMQVLPKALKVLG